MSEVHGFSDPSFEPVRETLRQRIASENELGASICVNIAGKTVLDIWGGHADLAKTRLWEKDTIGPVWSCSKVVTNLAALLLIDRGLLDPAAPVANHSSGLAAWETPFTKEDLLDLEASTARLAAQAPWWTPGSQSGYHLLTQGHLVGEIIRRVTGKGLQQFVAEELAGPLGADFHYGVPEELWPRTAELIKPAALQLPMDDPDSVSAKTLRGTPVGLSTTGPGFRGAVIGAGNGFSNARALARIGSIVSLDGVVDGDRPFLTVGAVEKLQEEQVAGHDLVVSAFVRFGLGVALSDKRTIEWIPEGRIVYWGGWGGSILIMDRDRKMTISYTMNKMSSAGLLGNENTEIYVKQIYEIVEALA
ncbi:hypothetical protein N7468_002127 [Penicillium chermesinum]|uniref:Beta-lactamase-related domain-containing protein n=1 Tax=Penicillium chermesinum TaxID=63820 RepID=A0A9W9PHX3_9EURO|nr:uncharacterized protein N7468_002127 [Penicillium chermesinum]KAJ5247144.1 hypothetical protein N7468_002127 [Penicillium chermesinum]